MANDPDLTFPGVNIQCPWSELLVSGKKLIETRSYPLPEKYKDKYLALIETPGQSGDFSARIIALIKFDYSFQYRNYQHWLSDQKLHLVSKDDKLFKYSENKAKWGWRVSGVKQLSHPASPPRKKGIRFTTLCRVPKNLITTSFAR
jgi:hypothetical protein